MTTQSCARNVGTVPILMAQVVSDENQQPHLIYSGVGDDTLYRLREGQIERINDPTFTNFQHRTVALQLGDRIVAVSNSITRFMDDVYLYEVVYREGTTPQNLCECLEADILNPQLEVQRRGSNPRVMRACKSMLPVLQL